MRMRKHILPATLSLFFFSVVLWPTLAQDELLPPDEVADLVERYVERGVDSFREGSYDEAALRYRKALKRDPSNLGALLGLARCRMALGAYDDARAEIAKAAAKHADSREPLVLAAEIDFREGKLETVVKSMEPVFGTGDRDVPALRAGLLLASAHAAHGRRGDAKDVLNSIVAHYKRRYDVFVDAAFNRDELRHDIDRARPISEEMTIIAAALRLYVEIYPIEYDFIENALELLGHARKLDDTNWEAWIEYVRVTRVERNRAIARARKARTVVTKRNPELADLYVEVAISLGVGWNQTEQLGMARSALEVNPKHCGAHAIVARIHLENNVYGKAAEHINKALKVNPNHRESLALKATLSYLNGDEKAFEAGMKKMLAVDPKYGEGFHVAGLVVASRQRRYEVALGIVRRGLGIDPTNFEAHTTVGIFLIYSDGVMVRNNRIRHASGPTGVGIGFKETSDLIIEDNQILYCATGLYIDVSPFQPVSHTYGFRFSPIGENANLAIENFDGERQVFHAELNLKRQELSDAALLRTTLTAPLMPVKTMFLIHWEALRLYLKGAPLFRKPAVSAPTIDLKESHP